MVGMRSLFRKPEPTTDFVFVKHARATYQVDVGPPGAIAGGRARVGHVRQGFQTQLQLGDRPVTLIFAGKNLTDDGRALSACGIRSGDKLLATYSAAPPRRKTPVERVDDVLVAAQAELVPYITTFVNGDLSPEFKDRELFYRFLSEKILQQMFMLDGIDHEDDPDARKRRKEVINIFHEYQADVDRAAGKRD
ncbi:uncharacterized protein V1510DRAFT_412474 [Dipodascopsis tothii]|uniref:uncharacterized protein n=1 Tax=Dipodascopsis tothii TaxID=44089 RepID=UPI0034CE70A2